MSSALVVKRPASPANITFSTIASTGALLGYTALNLANQAQIGLVFAILGAFFSGTLNAIFHIIPIQTIKVERTPSHIATLFACIIAAALGTGYIYGSTEEAARTSFGVNDAGAAGIGFWNQLSWIIPVSLVMYAMYYSTKNDMVSICCKKQITDIEQGLLQKDAADPEPEKALHDNIFIKILIRLIVAAATCAFVWTSARAAFELFKAKAEKMNTDAMTVVDYLNLPYTIIYGSYMEASVAAHGPQAVWVYVSSVEGLNALIDCLADFYKRKSCAKFSLAAAALIILGFTTLTTYLISTYGQPAASDLNQAILAFALTAAAAGNYTAAVKYANDASSLLTGQLSAVGDAIRSQEATRSFHLNAHAFHALEDLDTGRSSETTLDQQ